MNQFIQELKDLANQIRSAEERMSREVRENGREVQEGQEKMLRAIHRLHQMLLLIPDKLVKIAEGLEKPR